MLHYVCKYTPVELLCALGADPRPLDGMRAAFDAAESIAGPNICGFGKTVLEAVFAGEVRELVLTNCCDTIRAIHDILAASGKLDFLYLLDLPHCADACACELFADELRGLTDAYAAYSGRGLDEQAFADACAKAAAAAAAAAEEEGRSERYIGVIGARAGGQIVQAMREALPLPVRNLTCVAGRALAEALPGEAPDGEALFENYARALLSQMPCMRMFDPAARHALALDPALAGIVYHTVRFCDFYGMEYDRIQREAAVPVLKVESDWTMQGAGQLRTRIEAFAESLGIEQDCGKAAVSSPRSDERGKTMDHTYYAGIDSGSTSTDVVIVDEGGEIVASAIVPTGAGSATSGERALAEALAQAGIGREQLSGAVATGYGRSAVQIDGRTVTEITCHARGAHAVDPAVRTVVDIGGQDSKAIALGADGRVVNFAMNDKCAAGTGRFLEMMARALELDVAEMARRGADPAEDIAISSTCSVFAESEVVSLIAQGKDVDSIVHGLDAAIAVRAEALVRRVQGTGPFMMTGGVARNAGVVAALAERLGAPVAVDERCQLLGAYGAALIAAGL